MAVVCGSDVTNSKRNRERKTTFLLSFSVFFSFVVFPSLFLVVPFFFFLFFSFVFLSMFLLVFLFPSLFCSLSCFSPPFLSCPLVFIRGKKGREIYYLCPIMMQGQGGQTTIRWLPAGLVPSIFSSGSQPWLWVLLVFGREGEWRCRGSKGTIFFFLCLQCFQGKEKMYSAVQNDIVFSLFFNVNSE